MNGNRSKFPTGLRRGSRGLISSPGARILYPSAGSGVALPPGVDCSPPFYDEGADDL
jgi:hypothetical protein